MSWKKPPRVNFEEQAEYRWPFWKLGLEEDDLFGDLHERFNTVPMFIQDPNAFHRDVNEIARKSLNQQDFYSRLQQRRDQRLNELKDMDNKIGILHTAGYNRLTNDQRFHRIRLECFASLDCLVAFCASFLTPNEKGMAPSLGQFAVFSSPAGQANPITDMFLRSEERNARSSLFKSLAASLKPSTPDSRDLEHAELPPSPPEGDGEYTPLSNRDVDQSSLPQQSCASETPIKLKRKHSVGFDTDDSPQVKRPRPEPIDDMEHDETDTSGASEETNREDDVPETQRAGQKHGHTANPPAIFISCLSKTHSGTRLSEALPAISVALWQQDRVAIEQPESWLDPTINETSYTKTRNRREDRITSKKKWPNIRPIRGKRTENMTSASYRIT
ncbi:hypothetical protein CEP52_007756 [Fusarium oligoseptatum]|uniref:Uncharacterized protein n=1 Tax=Fusarium oligoseptatum TaxID=2604345 RepID=A0A428TLE7_9HYPO|nr:hypothetical protein CEP52_007756 [Fusarium oligoseptatum]